MAKITESELKNQIKTASFSPIYILYGDEDYLVRHYSEQIMSSTVSGPFSDFNLTKFSETASLRDIIDAARQVPAMGNFRCCACFNSDVSKFTDSEIDYMISYLENPNVTSVILFYFIGMNPGNSKSAKKFISECEKYGSIVKFQTRSNEDLIKLLCSGAGKRGCTMSSFTARTLIEYCPNDMNTLINELEKLCAFKNGQEITDSDIKLLCPRTLNYDAFGMIRELNSGNANKAMAILGELFEARQEPIAIFGALVYSYVNMYRVMAARKNGISLDDFANSMGIKSYQLKKAERDAKKLGIQKLIKSLDTLDECDKKLKSSAVDKHILLEETIIKLFRIAQGSVK